ncbi:hypothetical protein MATL_G00032250 [Megalops atlanticus]|uniref:Uncharacterized protein n=1 Tax=Megalops atlanticus TaxID=7932 RepID=A0A9D3QD31_MEGAT|nr:hypothetical protein MATL_G00032250 [Megalops atlanticus]
MQLWKLQSSFGSGAGVGEVAKKVSRDHCAQLQKKKNDTDRVHQMLTFSGTGVWALRECLADFRIFEHLNCSTSEQEGKAIKNKDLLTPCCLFLQKQFAGSNFQLRLALCFHTHCISPQEVEETGCLFSLGADITRNANRLLLTHVYCKAFVLLYFCVSVLCLVLCNLIV